MPRRRVGADPSMPPLSQTEKRDRQVKVRLTPTELARLQRLRPDLTPSGILGVLVDDVLTGRYRPEWVVPSNENGTGD
jgi:hypothetical protein